MFEMQKIQITLIRRHESELQFEGFQFEGLFPYLTIADFDATMVATKGGKDCGLYPSFHRPLTFYIFSVFCHVKNAGDFKTEEVKIVFLLAIEKYKSKLHGKIIIQDLLKELFAPNIKTDAWRLPKVSQEKEYNSICVLQVKIPTIYSSSRSVTQEIASRELRLDLREWMGRCRRCHRHIRIVKESPHVGEITDEDTVVFAGCKPTDFRHFRISGRTESAERNVRISHVISSVTEKASWVRWRKLQGDEVTLYLGSGSRAAYQGSRASISSRCRNTAFRTSMFLYVSTSAYCLVQANQLDLHNFRYASIAEMKRSQRIKCVNKKYIKLDAHLIIHNTSIQEKKKQKKAFVKKRTVLAIPIVKNLQLNTGESERVLKRVLKREENAPTSQITYNTTNVAKCIKVSSRWFRVQNLLEKGLRSRPWKWIRWKTPAPQNPPWGQTRLMPNGVNVFANCMLLFFVVEAFSNFLDSAIVNSIFLVYVELAAVLQRAGVVHGQLVALLRPDIAYLGHVQLVHLEAVFGRAGPAEGHDRRHEEKSGSEHDTRAVRCVRGHVHQSTDAREQLNSRSVLAGEPPSVSPRFPLIVPSSQSAGAVVGTETGWDQKGSEEDGKSPCRHIAPSQWPRGICRSLPLGKAFSHDYQYKEYDLCSDFDEIPQVHRVSECSARKRTIHVDGTLNQPAMESVKSILKILPKFFYRKTIPLRVCCFHNILIPHTYCNIRKLSKLVVFLRVSVSAIKELRRINMRGQRNIERQDEEIVSEYMTVVSSKMLYLLAVARLQISAYSEINYTVYGKSANRQETLIQNSFHHGQKDRSTRRRNPFVELTFDYCLKSSLTNKRNEMEYI
ncbi:hypothetical protein EAG_02225 [Camponotus floridanus]|uniref:Uncharacterized protein n=1 Tax=Camponotus floridanus TaxID=104421 RepID=E2AD01_CAMFO|nr:hypothetical protein EAG_02225 [Camponotus floridanus]